LGFYIGGDLVQPIDPVYRDLGCIACFAWRSMFSRSNGGLVSWILALPLLVVLGEMSYSIYLLHDPIKAYFVRNNAAAVLDSAALDNLPRDHRGTVVLELALSRRASQKKPSGACLQRPTRGLRPLCPPEYTVVATAKATERPSPGGHCRRTPGDRAPLNDALRKCDVLERYRFHAGLRFYRGKPGGRSARSAPPYPSGIRARGPSICASVAP